MDSPIRIYFGDDTLEVEYATPQITQPQRAVFIAINCEPMGGDARTPFGQYTEGSTVLLPFRANRILAVHSTQKDIVAISRTWARCQWGEPKTADVEFTAQSSPNKVHFSIPIASLGAPRPKSIKLTAWAKDMRENDGWGRLLADPGLRIRGGINDQSIDLCYSIDLTANTVALQSRRGAHAERVRIYQLLPRLFSNTNPLRKPNGTLLENGVGKFNDLDATALRAIKSMHFTHLWLTGILSQATSTDYSAIGLPADEPDLLKGLAGSPYAIRDYFDVSPDYAVNPAERLAEFQALVKRAHTAGLRVVIDFVANHVARSYRSTIRPEQTFGREDDRGRFFDSRNNFFWLQRESPGGGPPLRLPSVGDNGEIVSPTCRVLGRGDGSFSGERDAGRVTGNNVVSWRPSLNDWYETVKLNYGYDFTTGRRDYPCPENPGATLPDTWMKMDAVLAWWQSLGVDGFRCDMAHMVPPDFWAWAIDRARVRRPDTFFVAEAYDNDPMKVGTGNVMIDLLSAGFDAVYDDPSYKSLKEMYDGGRWANDLDAALAATSREYIFQNALRYTENHDEVRLAGSNQWGNVGPMVGRAASAILYGIGRGPILLYNGQEVGEPADGVEGFGGDDARTTIFDYWSMPELARWVNDRRYDGGKLRQDQRELREFYQRLLMLTDTPAFRDGEFFALNYAQAQSPDFGRLDGETASGHWLYAYLRSDIQSGKCFLVVANLHPTRTLDSVRVVLPPEALAFIGFRPNSRLTGVERLSTCGQVACQSDSLLQPLEIGSIPPLTPYYFELQNV